MRSFFIKFSRSCVDGSNVPTKLSKVKEKQDLSNFQPKSARFVFDTGRQGSNFL